MKPARKGAKAKPAYAETIQMLRALPPDARAEALVGMFKIVASEFAHLVLEHVKVKPAKPKRPKRVGRKVKRRG